MTINPALQRPLEDYIVYFENLTLRSVPILDKMASPGMRFRDPFNEVTGIEKIRHLFADMFVRLDEPTFTITETIEQPHGALLIWDFTFRIKTLKPEMNRRIHGTSHIRFAPDGRVQYHRDYWDAAGELYEQLPLVGTLMRFLKKRAG